MQFRLAYLLFSLFPFISFAQVGVSAGQFTIKGKVVDSASHSPLEYATVTLITQGTNTIAGGMITDDKGAFKIDHLAAGNYTLKVEFISYSACTRAGIALSDTKPIVNMGDISLAPASTRMKEVTITGSRNFMENHLDKFVYNVEKDVTSQGGVATDILKKVPQVTVDVDGNVELLGSGNVRVFVNGKPSTMFDNNLAEALQSIPASQIKSIEIISIPGAQYDAQGTGGIINIILKDNKSQGVSGNITLSAGTRLNNGSANIHARKGKVDLSASLSGNEQLKGTTLNSMTRTMDSTRLLQNGNGDLEKNGFRGQLGMDWAVSKSDNVTASLSYNNFGTINSGNTYQNELLPGLDTSTLRLSSNTFRYKTLDWNINYVHKFKKEGHQLNLAFQSSNGRGMTNFQQDQRYTDSLPFFNGARGSNRLTDNENYAIIDYALPFTKEVVFNAGVKGSFSQIYSYSDNYQLNPASDTYVFSQMDNFNFGRQVYAGYVSLSFPLFTHYSVKLGFRDEYTNINFPADTGAKVPSYNSPIPSIVIARKLGENQTIKLSYSKRIQRAGYKELNPFVDATDPANLTMGNPYLRPERTDAAELSYYRFFSKGSNILVSMYYRNTRDDEQSYILDSTITIGNITYRNAAITTNENAGDQQITGLNISGMLVVNKKVELRCSANIFDKYIVSELIPGNSINSVNYRINANATWQLSKTVVAEFFGNFNSQRTEIQGNFPSFTSYSFAVRKMLWKKKAGLAFTTTNPFNQYTNQATNITGPDFTLNSLRQIPYRSFGLSFNWKFGKIEFKEKKQENPADEGN